MEKKQPRFLFKTTMQCPHCKGDSFELVENLVVCRTCSASVGCADPETITIPTDDYRRIIRGGFKAICELYRIQNCHGCHDLTCGDNLLGKKVREERLTMTALQVEHRAWAKKNFPDSPSWHPLLGIFEEIGELFSADMRENKEEKIDAVGDIVIFLVHYCNRNGYDFFGCIRDTPDALEAKYDEDSSGEFDHLCRVRLSDQLAIAAGSLAHSHLKSEQEIRPDDHESKSPQFEQSWCCWPGIAYIMTSIFKALSKRLGRK
jgi:NTP pyrophosphatase (non-canonical NTP hydrolase)